MSYEITAPARAIELKTLQLIHPNIDTLSIVRDNKQFEYNNIVYLPYVFDYERLEYSIEEPTDLTITLGSADLESVNTINKLLDSDLNIEVKLKIFVTNNDIITTKIDETYFVNGLSLNNQEIVITASILDLSSIKFPIQRYTTAEFYLLRRG